MLARLAALLAGIAYVDAVTPMVDVCGDITKITKNGAAPDHSVFTEVLRAAVTINGTHNGIRTNLVNYGQIRKDPSKLNAYLSSLCDVNVEALSINAQMAFWHNAYNALMIAIIVHYNDDAGTYSVNSLEPRIGGVIWKAMLGTVAGEKVSLDIIEHDKVRGSGLSNKAGVAGRAHGGFVCASLSCPSILNEAFEADTYIAQITAATRVWLTNPTKNPGPDGTNTCKVSKIFKWYGGDFVMESKTVRDFLVANSDWNPTSMPADVQLEYIGYNWDLNGINSTAVPSSARGVSGSMLSTSTQFVFVSLLAFAMVLH